MAYFHIQVQSWKVIEKLKVLMISWPAYFWQDQSPYQSYHLQNSTLIYWSYQKDPYCILLLSVMLVDAAQKKRWWNLLDWEFYSRKYFRQDITLVELSLSEKWNDFWKWKAKSKSEKKIEKPKAKVLFISLFLITLPSFSQLHCMDNSKISFRIL